MAWLNVASILQNPIAITVTAVIIIGTLLSKYLSNKAKKFWADCNVKVGRTPSFYELIFKKKQFSIAEQEVVKKYGRLFGCHQFGKPTLFCCDPELISAVLSKDFTSFVNRRQFNFGNDEISNSMLSIVSDDKWKRIRAVVSPTFSSGKLHKMRPLIDDCLSMLVSNFDYLIAENEVMDVKIVYGAFTMNVICQVAFGTKVDALIDTDNPIILHARKIFNKDFGLLEIPKFALLFSAPKLANMLGLTVFDKEVMQFFIGLTKKIAAERKSNKSGVKRYDFLQLMLDAMENREPNGEIESEKIANRDNEITETVEEDQKFVTHNKTLSVAEMVSQCVLFFIAGYETTATTVAYATYLLACNPDIQEKLYAEAKATIEAKTEIDIDSISALKLNDAVVSETLRLYPPAIFLERMASEDYAFGSGEDAIKIKKGVIVHIPAYAMHRDAHFFAEPDAFKPERFFPENRAHHPYAYLPFGAGPRNCVARRLALMEAKLALLYSVYNFKFSTTDKTKHPPETHSNGGLNIPKEIVLRVEKRLNK